MNILMMIWLCFLQKQIMRYVIVFKKDFTWESKYWLKLMSDKYEQRGYS